MKKGWLTVMLVGLITAGYTQESTRNNYTGTWEVNGSWTDNTAPSATIGGSNLPLTINGYITRTGALTFANGNAGNDFTVNDTLVVLGSVTAGNNSANLRLGPNAVMIIFGDFSADNKIMVENGGILVVTGNMNFKHNGQGEYEDDGPGGELYVGGDVNNNEDAEYGEGNWSNLEDDYPELHDFIECGGWGSCSLPVKISYFTAGKNGDAVVLKWATTEEEGFQKFIVQRSTDGMSFEDLGEVEGKGFDIHDIETRYAFMDPVPLLGTNYYRLKAVDLDDSFEFFRVQMVRVEAEKRLSVYPNPSSGEELALTLNFHPEESDRVTVIDQLGVELFSVPAASADRIVFHQRLGPGVYFVKYSSQQSHSVTRVVVQR